MKSLIPAFLFLITISSCKNGDSEEVAKKYINAIFSYDFETARFLSTSNLDKDIEYYEHIYNPSRRDNITLKSINTLSEEESDDKVCYSLEIYYTHDGAPTRKRGKYCLRYIDAKWQVVSVHDLK
ncbi:MAG: hypothetical protein WD048_09685 [Chitinophagales bacterium]